MWNNNHTRANKGCTDYPKCFCPQINSSKTIKGPSSNEIRIQGEGGGPWNLDFSYKSRVSKWNWDKREGGESKIRTSLMVVPLPQWAVKPKYAFMRESWLFQFWCYQMTLWSALKTLSLLISYFSKIQTLILGPKNC